MTDDNNLAISTKVSGVDYLEAMLSGHRLALSIQDAWRSRIEAAIEPLIEMPVKIGAISFDKHTSLYMLATKLSEFFKDHIENIVDNIFSTTFVQQSYTEIVVTVANGLSNDVAAVYEFDALRRFLREIVKDFASGAKRLPKWKAEDFAEQLAVFLKKTDSGEINRYYPNYLPSLRMKRRDVWAARQFAKDHVYLLINDLRNLANDTESKLVETVLSPRYPCTVKTEESLTNETSRSKSSRRK